MPDFHLTQLSGLLHGLLLGEFILANKGYIGDWKIITPIKYPANNLEYYLSYLLSSHCWIVEHVLHRFKIFKVLSGN